MRRGLKAVIAGVLVLSLTGCAFGEDKLAKSGITASHQPYSHGLPSYVAEQTGLFENMSLSTELLMFTSGPAQNEALGADEWDVGTMGAPPSVFSCAAYDAKIIGFSVDDTISCDFWARPGSDISTVTGEVEGHPDIMGNAELWKGKTILCQTATSAHFMLISTLKTMGLTDEDVNIVPMDVSQAFTAFKAGQGDLVALWAPQSYMAEQEGWTKVSSGPATGESIPTVIIASEKAIQEKPELVKKWLEGYFESCDKLREDEDTQVKYLRKMQQENGIKTTEEWAKRFVQERPLPSLEENRKLFDDSSGTSQAEEVMMKIVDFFVNQGQITEESRDYLKKNGFLDKEFLELLYDEQQN